MPSSGLVFLRFLFFFGKKRVIANGMVSHSFPHGLYACFSMSLVFVGFSASFCHLGGPFFRVLPLFGLAPQKFFFACFTLSRNFLVRAFRKFGAKRPLEIQGEGNFRARGCRQSGFFWTLSANLPSPGYRKKNFGIKREFAR